MDALIAFRFLEVLYGTDEKNYSNDKDFRRWVQKVIYYLQCYSLKENNRPFIKQELYAYPDGPMVTSLHDELKKQLSEEELNKLLSSGSAEYAEYDSDLLEAVALVLSKYSGKDLTNISHTSAPWVQTIQNGAISKELMKEKFGEGRFEEDFLKEVTKAFNGRKALREAVPTSFKEE
tara:strand:- start:910 stop:1440 length:531 start_codon:yes stop_codon:yes gene_type:complete